MVSLYTPPWTLSWEIRQFYNYVWTTDQNKKFYYNSTFSTAILYYILLLFYTVYIICYCWVRRGRVEYWICMKCIVVRLPPRDEDTRGLRCSAIADGVYCLSGEQPNQQGFRSCSYCPKTNKPPGTQGLAKAEKVLPDCNQWPTQ